MNVFCQCPSPFFPTKMYTIGLQRDLDLVERDVGLVNKKLHLLVDFVSNQGIETG